MISLKNILALSHNLLLMNFVISQTEENYLKAICKITQEEENPASTNAVAAAMSTTPASVTDMLKRLAEKSLLHYEKYKGVSLTEEGQKLAWSLIRRHRLWEVFLVDKLGFAWDEVHDIAEQLEHIQSPALVEKLDNYLGFPRYDPHGDPIPDVNGHFLVREQWLLSRLTPGQKGKVVGVNEHSAGFLKYLDQLGLVLGTELEVTELFDYDHSARIIVNQGETMIVSHKLCDNLFVILID